MDEARLIEKMLLIEALIAGAATDGERVAAERARERIRERLEQVEREDPPIEYQFTLADMWSRKVFVALLRRYGIRPYRYYRQRRTTVMARVSKRFVDETLWPEFQEISETLRAYLSEVTERVVGQVIHQDSSEAEIVAKPIQLVAGVTPESQPADRTPSGQAGSEQNVRPPGDSTNKGTTKGLSGKRRKRRKRKKRKRR